MPAHRIFPGSGMTGRNFISLSLRSGAARCAMLRIVSTAPGGERRAKAGLRDFIVERYDAIIAQRAEPVFAFGGEAQKFHATSFLIADFAANNPSHDAKHLCHINLAP